MPHRIDINQMLLMPDEAVLEVFRARAKNLDLYYYDSEDKDMFLFVEGNMPVCLVAHIDTVKGAQAKQDMSLVCNKGIITATRQNEKNESVKSVLGADDRAGCQILYDLLKGGENQPHILLTNMEECGGIGAKIFSDANITQMYCIELFIEFDRTGCNEYVTYNKNPKQVHDYMSTFNIHYNRGGSYSDIKTISEATLVPSVNIACGYYLQHTTNEYLVLEEMWLARNKTRLILDNFPIGTLGQVEKKVFKSIQYKNLDVKWVDHEDAFRRDDAFRHGETEPLLFDEEFCFACGKWISECECIDLAIKDRQDMRPMQPFLQLANMKQRETKQQTKRRVKNV